MRPIKFRAWDKINQKMIEVNNLTFYSDKSPAGNQNIHIYDRVIDDFELMQFTGLLDKSGKEIYEGDIIRAEEPSFESGTYNWQIEWMNAAFLCRTKETTTLEPLFAFSDVEVIGNIYENLELLTP